MKCFADLHVHVGRNEDGKWVKIPSSKNLTVKNILKTAKKQKGIDVVGIVDVLSPLVQKDIARLIAEGVLEPLNGGGYRYAGGLTVLLGGEVETKEANGGLAHSLLFLPNLDDIKALSHELSSSVKNINISSQNAHMDLQKLYSITGALGAKIVPAHVFTPFKSIYGNCTDSISKLFAGNMPDISAIELGLSADAMMADRIDELRQISFLANSDAHSLPNIAREFTQLDVVGEFDFNNVFAAIEGKKGNVKALYGFNPALGKYYVTRCAACEKQAEYGMKRCTACGGRIVPGVRERIEEIADHPLSNANFLRVPYNYHIPLAKLPGIGKKTLEKIYYTNLTELFIIYEIDVNELEQIFGAALANIISKVRAQNFLIKNGGAGKYGYVIIT